MEGIACLDEEVVESHKLLPFDPNYAGVFANSHTISL
jgi:hypothetical protein